jgi:putative serine protease PepD
VAAVVGLMAVVIAGAAYAVGTALTGNGGNEQAVASGYQPWLGIDLYNSPYGGPIVVGVVPGSPAQRAGVEPGDVITQVDAQPVASASAFGSALAGKHAGDHVVLSLERGAVTYAARVTLANRPVANP